MKGDNRYTFLLLLGRSGDADSLVINFEYEDGDDILLEDGSFLLLEG